MEELDQTLQVPNALMAEADHGTAPSGKDLKSVLYARCASKGVNALLDQNELLEFGVIPNNDISLLQECINQLMKQGLLRVMKKQSGFCWKVVKTEDALKYKSLTQDEAIVYRLVEDAQREGIWTKSIRMKSNLHMTVVNHAIKGLENRGFIKQMRNVKFPSRKSYIVAYLQPSEAATGGPFYTDGILDEEFVHQMANWTERYIIGRSWSHRPQPETLKRKHLKDITREQAEKLRAEEMARGNIGRDRNQDMLPMPPRFTGYPTLSQITRAVNASGLSSVPMKEAEMLQVLEILVWDARIERVPAMKGYRAIRHVPEAGGIDFENGLTEAPCGRCPVFEICEDGGPVNATTCEYFEDWLTPATTA